MPAVSFVIPVYDRPDEIRDLLESMARQTDMDFETVIVEDGSKIPCREECERFSGKINLKYFYKENEGRSIARNYGIDRADGDFLVFIDSDCILPPDYVEKLKKELSKTAIDCYGGPDAAHDSFSDVQKAINFAMTSFLTTGGIRGGKVSMEKFVPRTFNMGFTRKVYDTVGGFREMFSEDIDMSTRIRNAGFSPVLLPDLYVYHKRRVDLRKFWRQVHVFGMSRITLQLLYPGSMKIVHWLPALFVLFALAMVIGAFFSILCLVPLLIYFLILFIWGSISMKSVKRGFLGMIAGAIQLFGYGTGFLRAYIWKIILRHGRDERQEIEMRRGK